MMMAKATSWKSIDFDIEFQLTNENFKKTVTFNWPQRN